jgi:hypothetical protein
MKSHRGLRFAGTALMAIGAVQVSGALYFCWIGGMEGILSPVTAVLMGWPVAALFLFLGERLRRVEV